MTDQHHKSGDGDSSPESVIPATDVAEVPASLDKGVGSSSGSELDSKEAMASSLSNGGGSNSSGNFGCDVLFFDYLGNFGNFFFLIV